MRPQSLDRLKALILILMAIFFTDLLVSGKLFFYIGPRFSWLSLLAVILFIILAGSYKLVGKPSSDVDHDHQHGKAPIGPVVTTALPLILGMLIPPSPLGASAISTHSVGNNTGIAKSNDQLLTTVPSERNILDWVQAMNTNPDPAALDGQPADVIGFVYQDNRFDTDQFLLARFTITCCVADAMAIGLVVQSPEAERLTADSWVRVQGTFVEGKLGDTLTPVLMAEDIAPIQAPEQPYLYP